MTKGRATKPIPQISQAEATVLRSENDAWTKFRDARWENYGVVLHDDTYRTYRAIFILGYRAGKEAKNESLS